METPIATSIEQSKKLIELGIDINTADMYWWHTSLRYYLEAMDDGDFNEVAGDIHAWSLSALMELIPNWTMDKTDKVNLTCNPYDHCESCYEDPVDSAFKMVCWLLENKKI